MIILRTLTGRPILLSDDDLDRYLPGLGSGNPGSTPTNKDLKDFIADRFPEYPAESQRLIFCGKELQDSDLVPYSQIVKEECVHLVVKQPQPEEAGSYFVFCQNLYDGESPGQAGLVSLAPVAALDLDNDEADLAVIHKMSKAWHARVQKNAKNQHAKARKTSAEAYFGIVFISDEEIRRLTVGSDMIVDPEEGSTINFTPVCYVLPGSAMALGSVAAVANVTRPGLGEVMRQFAERASSVVNAVLVEGNDSAAVSANGGGGSKVVSNDSALFADAEGAGKVRAPQKADVGCKCAIM